MTNESGPIRRRIDPPSGVSSSRRQGDDFEESGRAPDEDQPAYLVERHPRTIADTPGYAAEVLQLAPVAIVEEQRAFFAQVPDVVVLVLDERVTFLRGGDDERQTQQLLELRIAEHLAVVEVNRFARASQLLGVHEGRVIGVVERDLVDDAVRVLLVDNPTSVGGEETNAPELSVGIVNARVRPVGDELVEEVAVADWQSGRLTTGYRVDLVDVIVAVDGHVADSAAATIVAVLATTYARVETSVARLEEDDSMRLRRAEGPVGGV